MSSKIDLALAMPKRKKDIKKSFEVARLDSRYSNSLEVLICGVSSAL